MKKINFKLALLFAAAAYLFMVVVFPLISGKEITLKRALIGIPVWLAVGFSIEHEKRKSKIVKKQSDN